MPCGTAVGVATGAVNEAELLAGISFDGSITIHDEYVGSSSFWDMAVDGVVEQTREDLTYLKPMLSKYWSW